MLGRALEWRDGPLEPERDNISPVITVDYLDGNNGGNPQLRSSANEKVTNRQIIGPLLGSICNEDTFAQVRSIRNGTGINLTNKDAGKWYCFRAKDSADNWGYGNRRVPLNLVIDEETDTIKPVITVSYWDGKSSNPNVGGNPQLSASANENVTSWQYIGPLSSSNCANITFEGANTGG